MLGEIIYFYIFESNDYHLVSLKNYLTLKFKKSNIFISYSIHSKNKKYRRNHIII